VATPLDYAIVHGRPDLHDRLQKEGLPTEIGSRMMWHEGPVLSGATTALGLALGCVNQNAPAFDLSRTMKPRPCLRDIFPWGELVCECTLVALMGLVLMHHSEKLNSAYLAVKSECDGNKLLASADVVQLGKEKGDLIKKLESLHSFIDSRITWTTYIRGMAASLPANIQLRTWEGVNAMPVPGRGGSKAKKSLQFAASAPLTPEGAVPPEVAKFLTHLRTQPLLKRDFPHAELAAIRPTEGKNDKNGTVDFTIVCQPGEGKAGGGK
jgi:hypothetical protein